MIPVSLAVPLVAASEKFCEVRRHLLQHVSVMISDTTNVGDISEKKLEKKTNNKVILSTLRSPYIRYRRYHNYPATAIVIMVAMVI